jgi:hypothetical protein
MQWIGNVRIWYLSCAMAVLLAAPCYSSTSANTSTSETSQSDASEAYFALDHVVDVDIEMASEDWDRLRGETRTLFDILGGDCLGSPQADVFSWFSALGRMALIR